MEATTQTPTMFGTHEAWLKQRLGLFTASQISKLMKSGRGKGQMFSDTALTYINEKIAEQLTGQAPEVYQVPAMQHGLAYEFEAIQNLRALMPWLDIQDLGGANPVFFPYGEYAGGSPDGLTDEYVIEVKCPYNSARHVAFLMASRTEKEPAQWLKENSADYYAQIHLNMLATERQSALFVSYDPRTREASNRLAVIEIILEADYAADMIHRIHVAGAKVKEAIQALSPRVASHEEGVTDTLIKEG